jgi:hypothetical protein
MAFAAFIGAIFVWGRTVHCSACLLTLRDWIGSDPRPWHGRLARHSRRQSARGRLPSVRHATEAYRAVRAKES